ncbi:MAG: Gfo/Idh/MocA family oxidoreductase [Anaerolineae bacterium]|nr:Gfo/Idh/MocA family oxidoreductase [Anaerolineae bacterium]
MTDKIRWGILSTARIAENQVIPAIHDSSNGVVAAVGSRDLEKGKRYAERNKIPQVYGSYEELIAAPDIDAIYIPLPNGLHAEWSIKCAEGGKHVLCEKPLANDAPQAQHMADVFKQRDLLLAEAFMYRFHPQIQKVKQMIAEGALGTVNMAQATFSFPIGNEDDVRLNKELAGGALMDIGCYCVSITRYLFGEEPAEVEAFAEFGARSGVDERMVGIMRFPSGAMSHFDCSFRTHFAQTFELRGTQGRIYLERAYVPLRQDANADTYVRYWKGNDYQEIKVDKVNHYVLMVEDFADSLLNKRAPKFPIEESIAQMHTIDMLYASVGRQ